MSSKVRYTRVTASPSMSCSRPWIAPGASRVRSACAWAPRLLTSDAERSRPMSIIPRAGPPPLPSSTGAAASIRIPILHETVAVDPVAPVRGRDGDPVDHQVERKVDAPQGDAGVRALQFREARHDDLLLDQDFRHPEDDENTCRQGGHLGADVH